MRRLAHCLSPWLATTPSNPAISDENRLWTYAQLQASVEEAARYLVASDVRPGDRVMLVGENGTTMAALLLAAGTIDAWAVLQNARCTSMEVATVCEHARPRRVIYVVDNSPAAQEHAARHAAVTSTTAFGTVALGELDVHCDTEAVYECAKEQVAALIYTTGSTGTPKGVMLTHANLLHIAGLMKKLRSVTAKDRVYGVLPITHVMGLSSGLLGTLSAGAHISLIPRFSAQSCLQALQSDGVTILQGAPAMFAKLLDHERADRPLESSLRFIAVGGAPLDPALKSRVEASFGLPLHNGYGLTEASGSCWTRCDIERNDNSVGPATEGMEIRIVDADRNPVAPGAVGELWLRGANVMKGYYRDPERTALALTADGWFNSEDLARQTPDGHIHIVGRTKDLIIRSGFNVAPLEVETALNAHPCVRHSAVLGHMLDGNEEIVAVVESTTGTQLTEQELRSFLVERLSPYKVPTRILFVQTLPVAPNGKVLKHQLRNDLGELI